MENSKKSKTEEQIREVVARFIEKESNKTSLITVTHIELADRGRNGTIFVTVLPKQDTPLAEAEDSAINFLKRKRPELKDALKTTLNLHTIPFLDVMIDKGEKARQNIEALLREQ